MKTTRLLFYLLLLTLPLGQFSKIPIPIGGLSDVSIYLNDILLPLLLGIWLAYKLGVKKSLKLPPLAGNIFLFAAIAAISLFASLSWIGITQVLVAGLYLWRWLCYAGVYFVTWDLLKEGKEGKEGKEKISIIRLLLFSVFIFTIAGLVQFLLFPDFSKYVQHGWDPHYYRVLSTFFDPNFAGIFLTLGLMLTLSLSIIPNKFFKNKSLLIVNLPAQAGCLLLIVPIVLTFSRSTYLAFLIGVGIWGFIKSKKLLFVLLFFSFLVFLSVPRVRSRVVGAVSLDVTARARISDWQKTWDIIKDNWVLGVGFNTFRYAQENYGYFRDERGVAQVSGHAGAGADSSFLFILATTGVFGLLTYVVLLLRLWWLGWQNFRFAQGLAKALGLTMVASIPALIIHSQFVNSLFYPWIMEWMWVLAALCAASTNLSR